MFRKQVHNFNMRSCELPIKKINISDKFELYPQKSRVVRSKSQIISKTKSKRLFPNSINAKLLMGENKTASSMQNIERFQSIHSKKMHSLNNRVYKANVYDNNYQFFPKRSLLTKPHFVKNTEIALNLFGQKAIANQQRISVLAQSLYKQLSESRATNHERAPSSHSPRKPRIITRIQSARLVRQQSMKFTPWEMEEARDNMNRYNS